MSNPNHPPESPQGRSDHWPCASLPPLRCCVYDEPNFPHSGQPESRRILLAGFLAESPPERRQHALGRVAALEAGEDYPVLRLIGFGRHPRIIPALLGRFRPGGEWSGA
jgi:hypothetical protein